MPFLLFFYLPVVGLVNSPDPECVDGPRVDSVDADHLPEQDVVGGVELLRCVLTAQLQPNALQKIVIKIQKSKGIAEDLI